MPEEEKSSSPLMGIVIVVFAILGIVIAHDLYVGYNSSKHSESCYASEAGFSDPNYSECSAEQDLLNQGMWLLNKL